MSPHGGRRNFHRNEYHLNPPLCVRDHRLPQEEIDLRTEEIGIGGHGMRKKTERIGIKTDMASQIDEIMIYGNQASLKKTLQKLVVGTSLQ